MTLRSEAATALAMIAVGGVGYVATGGSADVLVSAAWFVGVPLAVLFGAVLALKLATSALRWVTEHPRAAGAAASCAFFAVSLWLLCGALASMPSWAAFAVVLTLSRGWRS